MKHGMTIEYLKCIADLNVEVGFGVNDAIATIVTKWDLILFVYNIISFINMQHMPLNCPQLIGASRNPYGSCFLMLI